MAAPEWLDPLLTRARRASAADLMSRAADPGVAVRRAAVLVLFGETEAAGPDILLIQRSAHLRSHAGQPAFPGGGIDATDDGPVGAALREAQEETGLDPDGVEVLTVLPELWVPPSANAVSPVLGWWRPPREVRPGDHEVASVARVPIADLVDPANRLQIRHPSGWVGPGFSVADMLVWGFTAGVLDALLELGGWTREWDRTRVEDLPADMLELAMRSRRVADARQPGREP
jgi:8-oxo-dGTP pyrophosphatase MutT (NUDIX family)